MSKETDEAVALRHADALSFKGVEAERDPLGHQLACVIAEAIRSLVARVEALRDERDRAWAEAEQGRDALAEGRTKQGTAYVIDLGAALKRSPVAEKEVAAYEQLIPETYYAGLPFERRVKKLVEDWQRAVVVNQNLEGENNALVARVEALQKSEDELKKLLVFEQEQSTNLEAELTAAEKDLHELRVALYEDGWDSVGRPQDRLRMRLRHYAGSLAVQRFELAKAKAAITAMLEDANLGLNSSELGMRVLAAKPVEGGEK